MSLVAFRRTGRKTKILNNSKFDGKSTSVCSKTKSRNWTPEMFSVSYRRHPEY